MHRVTLFLVALGCLLFLPLAGCQKLKARVELKQGNALYQEHNYKEALAEFQQGLALDPSATFAWRSVGFAALAQFRPGNTNPENLRYADVAIDAFKKYLAAYPDDQKIEEHLVSTLVNAERNDQALEYLRELRAKRPGDPGLDRGIIRILVTTGRLQEAFDWLEKEAGRMKGEDRAGLYYVIGVTAWDKSYKEGLLMNAAVRTTLIDLGLRSLERALEISPDNYDAMSYYNLLWREKAKIELDPVRQQEYQAKAEEWMQKASVLRKQAQEAAAKPQTDSPAAKTGG